MIPTQHFGSLSKLSTIEAVENIHNYLTKQKVNDIPAILILLDQLAAYDCVSHEILIRKMDHLGFTSETLEIMKSYLKDRYQVVYNNGHYSETKTIGPNSVIQGSVLSCILVLIYNLYQPLLAHIKCQHQNRIETENCDKTYSINYIDDSNTVITGETWDNVITKAEQYINLSR